MVALTFPDGARRDYPQGTTGLDIAKGISPSLAKRTVAMALDGTARRSRRPDRARRQDRIRHPRGPARAGTDPARRRARHGRSGAVAVARHAGHHRPGDRERLLLRLLPQPAVHAGRPARHRKEDEGDRRARQTLHQGNLVARAGQENLPRHGREFQGRAGRRHSGRPADQDLQAGRLVRSLPRPAHDLDRQGRQRLQADEGGRRLLARRFSKNPMLTRIYGTAFAKQEELDAYLKQIEEAEKRDHRRLGREMDLFHFQEEAPGSVFWHAERLDAVPGAGELHPPPPAGRRLRRGELAAADGPRAVGHHRPHADLQRHDVPDRQARGGRARLRHQADELPRPRADLQERPEVVPRPAAARSPNSARCTASSRRARCTG